MRGRRPASPGARPQRRPALLAPRSRTSSPQSWEQYILVVYATQFVALCPDSPRRPIQRAARQCLTQGLAPVSISVDTWMEVVILTEVNLCLAHGQLLFHHTPTPPPFSKACYKGNCPSNPGAPLHALPAFPMWVAPNKKHPLPPPVGLAP